MDNHFGQLNMILLIKLFFGVPFEISIFGDGQIWRIEEYKITRPCIVLQHRQIIAAYDFGSFQGFSCGIQAFPVTNFRVFVFPIRHVELSLPIDPVQAVEASSVKENRSRCCFGLRQGQPFLSADRIESLRCVFIFLKISNHIVYMPGDLTVQIDKLRIAVCDDCVFRMQREEHCAAAEKRLYISPVRVRHLGQQII